MGGCGWVVGWVGGWVGGWPGGLGECAGVWLSVRWLGG